MMDDSGEETRLDLSALAPNQMDGIARMMSAMTEDGVFGALAASPAGQLFAVNNVNGSRRNGRIPQAMLTMGRYFNVVEEIEPWNPTEFTAVLNDVAKITSGWTAADNALIMLETRKKQNAMGGTIDSSVTTPEVMGAFLGFGTKSTKELYEISKHRTTEKKKHEEQVMARYRDIMTYYKNALGADKPDVQHIQRVSSMLMQTFPDPYDRAMVTKQWSRDMVGPEQGLFKSMLDATSMPNATKLEDDIKTWPVDQATKDQMLQRLKDIKAMRENNKEGN
jgi:hypothetical protein